ncbi:hypothetical protein, partial [Rheinheimera sp. KL1]|uniref:hypothetical protein n=1 Tax=Rheinheimera sp. KL1 TaxID=1635005 RepID=UPI00256F51B6
HFIGNLINVMVLNLGDRSLVSTRALRGPWIRALLSWLGSGGGRPTTICRKGNVVGFNAGESGRGTLAISFIYNGVQKNATKD